MGKITPGVTPEDEFRRAINEAGGVVQINSTPDNLLKALKDIGGDVSYDSGDAAIVPAVNEGSNLPDGDVDFKLCYTDSLVRQYDRYLRGNTYRIIPISLFYTLGGIGATTVVLNRDAFCDFANFTATPKNNSIEAWLYNVKIPNNNIYVLNGTGLPSIFFTKCTEIDNALSENNGSFIGMPMRVKIKAGVFVSSGKYNNEIDLTFNYGDDEIYNKTYPDNADTICGLAYNCNISNTSGTGFNGGIGGSSGVYSEDGMSMKSSGHYNFMCDVINACDSNNIIKVGIYSLYTGWLTYDMGVTYDENTFTYTITSEEPDPLRTGNLPLVIMLMNIKPVYDNGVLSDIIVQTADGVAPGARVRITHI